MPAVPHSTTTFVPETGSQGNTAMTGKVAILVVVGLVLSTAVGFIVWYKLSKRLREGRFKTKSTLAKNGYNELDKSNINTIHSPILPGDTTLELASFIDHPKENLDEEDDDAQKYQSESLHNPPFMNLPLDPQLNVSYQKQERTVDICHALESSKSCQVLVEEWSESSPIECNKKGPMARIPLSDKAGAAGPPGLGWF